MAKRYYQSQCPRKIHPLTTRKSAREMMCEQEIVEKIKKYQTIRSEKFKKVFETSIMSYHEMTSEDLKPLAFTQLLKDTLQLTEKVTSNSAKKSVKQKQHNLQEVNCAAFKWDFLNDLFCKPETIRSALTNMHDRSSSTPACTSGEVHILDITEASQPDISAFLKLFKEDASFATPTEGMKELLKFIPTAPVQTSPPKHETSRVCASCSVVRMCDWCKQELCTHNLPTSCSAYPRTGQVSSLLCSDCISYNTQKDAEDWEKASLDFLEEPSDDSIIASIGCALVAIALGLDSLHLLKKIANKLHRQGKNKMAYRILLPAFLNDMFLHLAGGKAVASTTFDDDEIEQEIVNEKQSDSNWGKRFTSILANIKTIPSKSAEEELFLASSILKDLVKFESFSVEEKRKLIIAAKEAFSVAKSKMPNEIEQEIIFKQTRAFLAVSTKFNKTEMLNGDEIEQEIDSLIFKQIEELLEFNWKKGNILSLLKGLGNYSQLCTQALQQYLHNKEASILVKDQITLTFLNGVLKLINGDVKSAIFEFESAAWNLLRSSTKDSFIIYQSVVGAYTYMQRHHGSDLFSTKVLKQCLNLDPCYLSYLRAKERSISLYFATDHDLTPPPISPSPSKRKLSDLEVASMYISEAEKPVCIHKEVICYLHAAMWIMKNLNCTASSLNPDVLYTFKSVVIELLSESCEKALNTGNPGLELYAIRIAIGIIRKLGLLSVPQHIFTDEDHTFLKMLFQKLTKVSHMFPFWNPPPISPSEACEFHHFTSTLHSDFSYVLQFIQPEYRLVKDCELTYQLYRNDIFSLLPIENSLSCRARAMDEELKAKGLTWSDVTEAMSSQQYCPRDEEGWIDPSKDLNLSQQYYSEVLGFTLDVSSDKPTLKLLVAEADPTTGKRGLFSSKDIATMLQLDASDKVFFSLDPPPTDLDKPFHLFQAWRFSEKLRGTEVLKTMFLADYMMKSFVTGVDISSQPPFKQRACKDGLFKNLPTDVQEALRPTHERGSCMSREKRYWIELVKLKYKDIKNASYYDCRIGEVCVEIKSESLHDNYSHSHCPHVLFAKDMTRVYTKLCNFFPVFARLRELYKLHFFSLKLQKEIRKLMTQYPDKAHNLEKFLKDFKQPPSPSTGKCIFVPAVMSPNVIYGGVIFCENVPENGPRTGGSWEKKKEMFVTGCDDNELLNQGCKHPLEIIDKKTLKPLEDILDPSGGGVRQHNEKIPAIIIQQGHYNVTRTDTCGARKLMWSVSCDPFSVAHDNITQFPNFTILPVQRGITMEKLNFTLNANASTTESEEVGGVRFSVIGKFCQDTEFFLPLHVTEIDSEAFLPSNVSEVIHQPDLTQKNYTPPSDIAMRQHIPNPARFNSWNLTVKNETHFPSTSNNSSNTQAKNAGEMHSSGIFIVAKALHNIMNGPSSAKKPLTFSFREENSPSLNKQIDRLTQIVFMELLNSELSIILAPFFASR